MKLYFQNSWGNERLIAEVEDEEQAFQEIKKFCYERDFTIYYTRRWVEEDGQVVYDVGSHTEFFILDPCEE